MGLSGSEDNKQIQTIQTNIERKIFNMARVSILFTYVFTAQYRNIMINC